MSRKPQLVSSRTNSCAATATAPTPVPVAAPREFLISAAAVDVAPGETFIWVNDSSIARTVMPIVSSTWCLTQPSYIVAAGGQALATVAPNADRNAQYYFTTTGPQPCGVGKIIIR